MMKTAVFSADALHPEKRDGIRFYPPESVKKTVSREHISVGFDFIDSIDIIGISIVESISYCFQYYLYLLGG